MGTGLASGLAYNQQDFFGEVAKDADELSGKGHEIEDSFNKAFESFATGAKTSGQAMRSLGIDIAENILDKTTKIATSTFLGSTFNLASSIFNQATTPSPQQHATGGLISQFASGGAVGGKVVGGSGTKDDVPSVLKAGSYVINKQSVDKYGSGLLDSLNGGGRVGYATGGGVNLDLTNQYDYTDFHKQSNGHGVPNSLVATGGKFNVDSRLSAIGQDNPNDPANKLKFGREQKMIDYDKSLDQYQAQIKALDASENDRIIGAGISAVVDIGGVFGQQAAQNSAQNNQINLANSAVNKINSGFGDSLTTAEATAYNTMYDAGGIDDSQAELQYIGPPAQTGFSAFTTNPYSNSFNSDAFSNSIGNPDAGGYNVGSSIVKGGIGIGVDTLQGHAAGGRINTGTDNVPAMLTGGEYVMSRDAVNKHGTAFMDKLNRGEISHFAAGGVVGSDFNSVQTGGSNSDISTLNTSLLQLVKTLQANNTKTNNPSSSSGTTNHVTINMTTNNQAGTNNGGATTSNSKGSTSSNDKNQQQNVQKFTTMMHQVALNAIIREQRNGGLLYGTAQ